MALTKIILMNKQILTIHDALYEDDAFNYDVGYPIWVETILNKESDGIRRRDFDSR